jgi:cell division protein FtsQ
LRKNRRRGTRPFERLRLGAGSLLAGLVAPLLALGGLAAVARWASTHPYFHLQAIEIEGAREPDAVLAWIDIERGRSLWSIDPKKIELRLRAHARVRAVSVRREFPDRLSVAVEERRPLALVLFDEPLFLDAEGRAFPPLREELRDDYPYVTGIAADDLDVRPGWVAARLREAAKILQLWQHHPDWPAVSEVRLHRHGGFVAYPERSRMAIRFGEDVDPEQFARLSTVLELWRGREIQVAAVDLTVPGQAVLRLRAGAKRPDRRVTI